MGVHGLWRLIEPSGKPVPLDTLENKVLAVDISLWLHQAVKGFQDSRGAPIPNAHLLGIYHRLCKLLYFRIKPVFVFDGGVPELKKQTIAKRKQSRSRNSNKAEEIQKELLHTILKHTAVSKVLEDKLQLPEFSEISKKKKTNDDMFALDNVESNLNLDSTISSSDEETESYTEESSSPSKYADLHNVDLESKNFKSLPVDVRHEILTDLKETRKQSSWGKIHQIPKISHEFSSYQMQRLLKRQAVQSALEQAEKEMGGKTLSLAELESMLKDQGIITDDSLGKKIASDEHAKYLLVKANQKEAISKKLQTIPEETPTKESSDSSDCKLDETKIDLTKEISSCIEDKVKTKAELEFDADLNQAIALSLMEEPSTSKKSLDDTNPQKECSFMEKFRDADFMSSSSDNDSDFEEINNKPSNKKSMASAEHYMIEYSGLTPSEIAKILESKKTPKTKNKYGGNKSQKDLEITEVSTTNLNREEKDDIEMANLKINESSLGTVEVMSSSSEESNDFVEVDSTKVDIIINPNETLNAKDDLFSDIFNDKVEESDLKVDNKKEIQITIDINEKEEDKDDLFSDVFGSKESESELSLSLDMNSSQTSLDDVIKLSQSSSASNNVKEVCCAIKNNKNEIGLTSQQNKPNDTLESKVTPIKIDTKKEETLKEHSAETQNSTIASPTHTTNLFKKVSLPDDSIEIIDHLQKANRTGSLKKQLTVLKDKLQQETNELFSEKAVKQRLAENITDEMYQEAQDLLELFGVPYIIAPMEAEAQCAFLEEVELTNGTITDDSDIWLFGGKTVYKNFFNQNKYVMEFRAENIEHHFKLSREQMILLALLVGSDYTNGLQGVGPVTALEILAAFPPSKLKETDLRHLVSGLTEFRSWFTKGKSVGIGRTALKKKLKNVTFTDNFPSVQVVQAYLEPKVETSDEVFTWGRPNFEALILFAQDKFGWTRPKAEQIMNPVLQKMQENRIQRSIKDYFTMKFKVTDSGNVQDQMSKRVKTAIRNMGMDPDQKLAEEFAEEIARELKIKSNKRKADKTNAQNKKRRKNENSEDTNNEEDKESATETNETKHKTAVKRTIKTTEETKGVVAPKKLRKTRTDKESKKQKSDTQDTKFKDIEKETALELRDITEESEDIHNTQARKEAKDKETGENTDFEDSKIKHSSTKRGKTCSNKAKSTKSKSEIDLESNEQKSDSESTNSEDEITNKIAQIRQRREHKRLKTQLEVLNKKAEKSKVKDKKKEQAEVQIPNELQGDEDVNVLVQTALISESKVEQIFKQAQADIDNLHIPSASKSTDSKNSINKISNVAVPTRIPKMHQKDVILQKKKDQAMILRNKMKAIEVFRKGKKGPGYMPKTGRKKPLPKADAELSENSD